MTHYLDHAATTPMLPAAVEALAEAGRAFGEPGFVEAAERCATFVLEALRPHEQRLGLGTG